jgi:hypothetical protein
MSDDDRGDDEGDDNAGDDDGSDDGRNQIYSLAPNTFEFPAQQV